MVEERQSNFELLRILAVLFVLCGHYVTKGGMVWSATCLPQKASLLLWGGGKLGVSVFALLTGYFANARDQKHKIIKIWFELLFFSLISLVLYMIFDSQMVDNNLLFTTFFPVSRETWWYMSIYIFILALSPYIFRLISDLDKIEYKKLIIILLTGFTLIPTLIYKANPYFSNLGWLIVLYVIGYYIKKHARQVRPFLSIVLFISSVMIMWLSELILENYENIETNYLIYMFRLPMVIAAVSLVLYFKEINMGYKKVVNGIAQGTLGVYLLHDGLFFRNHWWSFIKTDLVYGSWMFVFHMLISSLILFVLGCCCDLFYNLIVNKVKLLRCKNCRS